MSVALAHTCYPRAAAAGSRERCPAPSSGRVGGPVRTCVGCGETDAHRHMLRLVVGPDGELIPDLARRALGRGSWMHARPHCLARCAAGLRRAHKQQLRVDVDALHAGLVAAGNRRVSGLLAAASRAGALATGTTPVRVALERGDARMLIVARDARSAARTTWVEQAVADGRAWAWASKRELGEALGRVEVGVLAVLDDGFEVALSQALRVAHLPAPQRKPSKLDRAEGR